MSFDLPALPEHWRYSPLATCCEENSVTYGVVQPGPAVTEGKPLIRVNNFNDMRLDLADVMHIAPEIEAKYARTRLTGGEVLLTIVGSVGQVAVVPSRLAGFNVARAVAVIHPLKDIAPEWIAICLRSPLSQHLLGSRANTTVQTTINLKDLRALPIPLPPMDERHAIAEFVGALDDRIALLRGTNSTLAAIAQALFKSWFVDFDPVRAKEQGHVPEGMDEDTAALFPETLRESELGPMPDGWGIGRLDDLLILQRGFDLPAGDRVPGNFPIIAASGPSGSHKVAMARGPGVITGRSGVLGRVFLELDDYWPLNTALWVKDFKAATPCFAYELLRRLDLKSFNAGSAVPTLNRNHVHSLPYIVPNFQCIKAYEKLVITLHQRVRANKNWARR
jgi:type I restriction enzyme S subunit